MLGGASLFFLGCTLLTPLDELGSADSSTPDVTVPDAAGDATTNDAPVEDVSTIDSPADAPPGDAGTDANGNLITNGSFEIGMGGCGTNWGNGYGQTFSRVSPGRTGPYACEVCIQGTQTSYQFNWIPSIPVQPGSYYAEAWFMTPDGGVPADPGIQVYYTGDGGVSGCSGDSTYCQGNFSAPPVGSWISSSTSFVVSGSGTVAIDVHSYQGTPSSCFEVDDVALYAQ